MNDTITTPKGLYYKYCTRNTLIRDFHWTKSFGGKRCNFTNENGWLASRREPSPAGQLTEIIGSQYSTHEGVVQSAVRLGVCIRPLLLHSISKQSNLNLQDSVSSVISDTIITMEQKQGGYHPGVTWDSEEGMLERETRGHFKNDIKLPRMSYEGNLMTRFSRSDNCLRTFKPPSLNSASQIICFPISWEILTVFSPLDNLVALRTQKENLEAW